MAPASDPPPLSLEDFVEITLNMLEDQGWEDHLPTLCFPDASEIQVVEGIPDGIPHTAAVRHLCAHPSMHGKTVFVAVKATPSRIDLGELLQDRPPRFLSIVQDDDGSRRIADASEEALSWWNAGDRWLPEA